MILIADSGSTKTTWALVQDHSKIDTCSTSGINPFLLEKEDIFRVLKNEFSLPKDGIDSVYFYGSGCIPEKAGVLYEVLEDCFQVPLVEVHSDLFAAARSLCSTSPGIVCILGTGSNSGFYDGEKIVKQVSPLGFILGDEGSGAALGKKLLSDVLKNQLPESIIRDFFITYPVSPAVILENVYRKPFPNRYMAQYTHFIARHVHEEPVAGLAETSFLEFIDRNLMQYDNIDRLGIYFTGSIAWFFSQQLKTSMEKRGLRIAKITQSPMEDLIRYHLNHRL